VHADPPAIPEPGDRFSPSPFFAPFLIAGPHGTTRAPPHAPPERPALFQEIKMTPISQGVERTLTLLDHARLRKLAAQAPALQELLDQGDLVESNAVAADVVTMNSQVLLAEGDAVDAPRTLTLCYPADAGQGEGHVSVLSPVGTSLLGARVGATVHWQSPAGERAARIVGLPFQPEAAGELTR